MLRIESPGEILCGSSVTGVLGTNLEGKLKHRITTHCFRDRGKECPHSLSVGCPKTRDGTCNRIYGGTRTPCLFNSVEKIINVIR